MDHYRYILQTCSPVMVIASRFVHRAPIFLAFLDLMLVTSLFLAPLSVPHGTVTHLDANANWIDHTDRWKQMDPFPMIVYTFGDLNCHQMMNRSLIINGNQLPVCARDTATFIGVLLGIVLLIRARAHDHPSIIFASILPGRFRRGWFGRHPAILFTGAILLLLVPTALDGGIQALSYMSILPWGMSYESTNPTRILTGFPFGMGLGFLLTTMVMALFSRREEGGPSLLKYLFSE
ncbi:hypothetical protein B6U90_06035 [Thermoplasmatales archaeon ex4484_6]|nr:MAG: hypothetical protein B6U90_06035 [Thermoplasmatales archaeon ex4484_6]RLF68479.1 MAG: hypothetical protein DRN57_03870 [Thermoplasmata archaeon]